MSSLPSSSGNPEDAFVPSGDPAKRQTQIRDLAEDLLSFRFFSTWQKHIAILQEREALDPDDRKYFTDRERFVLDPGNYRNVGVGFVVGAATFASVMGLSMWRRQGVAAFRHLWNPEAAAAANASKSSSSSAMPKSAQINLDRIAGKRKTTTTSSVTAKKTAAPTEGRSATASSTRSLVQRAPVHPKYAKRARKQQFKAEEDDGPYTGPSWNAVWLQMETIAAMGLAAVAGVTLSFTMDREKLSVDMERLPLDSGRSHLSSRACPALIQMYQKLILEGAKNQTPTRHWKEFANTNKQDKQKHRDEEKAPSNSFTNLFSFRRDDSGENNDDNKKNNKEDGENNYLDIQMHADMFNLQQYQVLTLTHDLDPESLPTDQDLWSQPQNRQLETMIRMVHNCQQRMQFIEDHREAILQSERDAPPVEEPKSDDADFLMGMMGRRPPTETAPGAISLPEPGVPPTYLGAVVTEDENEEVDEQDGVLQTVFPERPTLDWRLVLY